MLEVELLPQARDDFEESYAWYFRQSEPAAERFATAIENAIEKICRNPAIGIRLDDDHRFYRIKRSFPFYLVYRIEPAKLVVVAVAHNSRRPGYWRQG